jgi:hypothetical protein
MGEEKGHFGAAVADLAYHVFDFVGVFAEDGEYFCPLIFAHGEGRARKVGDGGRGRIAGCLGCGCGTTFGVAEGCDTEVVVLDEGLKCLCGFFGVDL